MKKLVSFLLVVLIFAAMIILYQNQLGAISFFILSIFFFILAIKGLSGGSEGSKGKLKKKKPRKHHYVTRLFKKKPHLRKQNNK